jgi:RND superfamily putative drug exporter
VTDASFHPFPPRLLRSLLRLRLRGSVRLVDCSFRTGALVWPPSPPSRRVQKGSVVGGIDPFLPILLFVILFGLSMDYHVFVLSRVREGYESGMSTDEAVAHGIKTTAGVVTSAAIVMVGVFAIFGTLQMMILKQFGVGLASAILIDATIVRAILLPATMKLLGDWNWYLPKWLEWLPRLEHEQAPKAPPAPMPVP